jgi:hypothetical protein
MVVVDGLLGDLMAAMKNLPGALSLSACHPAASMP